MVSGQEAILVTAVIPNWNGAGRIERLIEDLASQKKPPVEIIVVDNGSTDDSPANAEKSGARVIRFASNRGFTAAVNRGVAESKTELVAVLNNDLRLIPEWLSLLVETLRLTGSPFATGKLLALASPEFLDGSFDAICRGGCSWRCGAGRPDGPVWSQAREISFPPFTALVIRRDFFLSQGGLDEGLGSYLEDVDFGLRCASKGYTGRYVPDAIAYHEGSGTLGRWSSPSVRQIARNQLILLAKHYPTALLIRFGWPIAVAHLLWGLLALKHGAGFAWLLGKVDGIRIFASHRTVGERIGPMLDESEQEIRRLQQQTGWDWYWRLYFALT